VFREELRFTSNSQGFMFSSIRTSNPRSSKQHYDPCGTNIFTPLESKGSADIRVFTNISSISSNSFSTTSSPFCFLRKVFRAVIDHLLPSPSFSADLLETN
jgi:hypothetical protein